MKLLFIFVVLAKSASIGTDWVIPELLNLESEYGLEKR